MSLEARHNTGQGAGGKRGLLLLPSVVGFRVRVRLRLMVSVRLRLSVRVRVKLRVTVRVRAVSSVRLASSKRVLFPVSRRMLRPSRYIAPPIRVRVRVRVRVMSLKVYRTWFPYGVHFALYLNPTTSHVYD